VLAGVPGLSDMPIVGRLFAHNKRETLETDIVMTLTPRIVRVLELTEADLRPFRVGREGDGAGVLELPIPAVIPPPGGRPPVGPTGPTPVPPADPAKPAPPAPVQPITPPPAR
jgi:general secretion pathway protein D